MLQISYYYRMLQIPLPMKFKNSLLLLVMLWSTIDQSVSLSSNINSSNAMTHAPKIILIPEKVWRKAAKHHRKRISELLKPGLTPRQDQIHTNDRRRKSKCHMDEWTALDPVNPIYNFLIEYYGIKGAKGPRRLGRWSPNPSLLLHDDNSIINNSRIMKIDCFVDDDDQIYKAAMEASHGEGGIFLQNANEEDMGGTLHLRGSVPILSRVDNDDNDEASVFHGVLYNPALFYNRHQPIKSSTERQQILKTIAPFQWYSSILRTTLSSEPILNCHGLHEWAMQYHPPGAPPPPSAKYQSSLPLRVSRDVINDTVERKGISCTHVDALRFFAPAAGPLNYHGAELERTDQLRLEQKACVHAHMDLLKIALKLQPFLKGELLQEILEVAIKSRRLDVEASPYDAHVYGLGVVPVETKEGRRVYRERQMALMEEVEPVRMRLLKAYEDFMELAFDEELLGHGIGKAQTIPFIAQERLAKAQPGGLPWRHNSIVN